jgi:hypothetical protein
MAKCIKVSARGVAEPVSDMVRYAFPESDENRSLQETIETINRSSKIRRATILTQKDLQTCCRQESSGLGRLLGDAENETGGVSPKVGGSFELLLLAYSRVNFVLRYSAKPRTVGKSRKLSQSLRGGFPVWEDW